MGEDLHRRLHWIWCLRRICGGAADSASDGAHGYGEEEGRRMGEEAGGTRGQNSGSFELREGGGDRREAARSVGGGGVQVGKSR